MAVALIPKESDRILCVKVGKVKRENLYEMARKYWVVSLERASLATHVLAVIDGVVEAVYIPQSWKLSEERDGRCEFMGKEDPQSEYLGKDVRGFYGHSANPVKYINM